MPGCLGCSCQQVTTNERGGTRILLATRVSHNRQALRAALAELGDLHEPVAGLIEVHGADPVAVVLAARRSLTSIEADEVRALVSMDLGGDDLLARALTAPSLAEVSARSEHADLVPMFADEERSFHAVYQPIVSLTGDPQLDATGPGAAQVVGYEALLRASGPSGQIMPDQLFASAAQAGWLHVLDRIGRTSALRGAAGWLGGAKLFVNFLPTTIYRPEVCLATTEQAARRAGISLDQVVFEVTESERVIDLDHLARVFDYYRQMGCKVALDDLGAGYSSLNVLVRLQPDIVKLDKEIVQKLPDAASSAVVAAVVKITRAYGGTVLAECIETREQAVAARELGVELGQGWYFGRPQDRREEGSERPATTPRRAARRAVPALSETGDDPAVALLLPAESTSPESTSPEAGSSDVDSSGAGAQDSAGPVRDEPAGLDDLLARAVQASHVSVTIADTSDPDLPLIYVNESFEALTGYTAAESLGQNCRFLQVPATDRDDLRTLRRAMSEGRDHVAVLRNRRKDGTLWWNELRLSPIRDPEGRITHVFGFQHDVSDRVEAEQQVRHLATHDRLTGLPNRDRLLQELASALGAATLAGSNVAVLFVDLDGFKKVNDALGHSAGDLALIATAARMRGALRESDVVARYSGDEFVIVLPGVPAHLAGTIAQRTADALQDTFSGPIEVSGQDVVLSASIGLALFPQDGDTAQDLIDAADRAMYAAKAKGRGGVVRAG